MAQSPANISKMVSAAPVTARKSFNSNQPATAAAQTQWAPAWFYSALNWLGKSYPDANNKLQQFNNYLAGSDVDPYAQLGSTRLFLVLKTEDVFRLSIAADINSTAGATESSFPVSDAGILDLYNALAASPVFPAVKYCYVPGRNPSSFVARGNYSVLPVLEPGYDPATGIRVIVEGSAVTQAIPLTEFAAQQNKQIYNEDPQIVPIFTSLVYDITQNNAINATTFTLPVYYCVDAIDGAYYVNKIAATIAGAMCGQSVLFSGGPGYDDTQAQALTLNGTTVANLNGQTITTYIFDKGTAVSQLPLQPRAEIGVCTLTYSGTSPLAIFAEQSIVGYYCDAAWQNCLGVPIYSYGQANGSFTSTSAELTVPALIYGPSNEFLNGGALPNVLQKLMGATYMLSSDTLVSILNNAITVPETSNGAGLSVMSASLDFTMDSTVAAPIVNQFSLPLLGTVTTTPQVVVDKKQKLSKKEAARQAAARSNQLPGIGAGGNGAATTQLSPTTIEVALTATIPGQVLAKTGISGIGIGTVFPQQTLGDGSAFASDAAGVMLNLMSGDKPALPPVILKLSDTGVNFKTGVTYTLLLLGSAVTITGSDDSSADAVLAAGINTDTSHTFAGMLVFSSDTTVTLYPLLSLTFPAPAVGTNNILQGGLHTIRFTYQSKNCSFDIIGANQIVISSGVTVPTPNAMDNSTPQPGALYFGSFTGGTAAITVWSVPVFAAVTPDTLSGAAFNGVMTLGTEVTGSPNYDLKITDSSLFVFSNINIDAQTIGSVSAANVYMAGAVINSAPDDNSPQAFAPGKLLMGIIRQVQMSGSLRYVFIPEDDSIVIGGIRYLASVINLDDMSDDPNALPYPPSYWAGARYWQFANRHNPYLAVQYTGQTETDRKVQAYKDIDSISRQLTSTGEPMQLIMDADPSVMTLWPIYPFPYATSTQSIDQGLLSSLSNVILSLLDTNSQQPTTDNSLQFREQVSLSSYINQNNPYTSGITSGGNAAGSSPLVMNVAKTSFNTGQTVTNLSPNTVEQFRDMEVNADSFAMAKILEPAREVVQSRTEATPAVTTTAVKRLQPIYGFTVYNASNGEAYIVEVVGTDVSIPDQLPGASKNTTYDPYYVRVVFLKTLTCYNMSIIVPAMARDQYRYFGLADTVYQNLLSKTDELHLGYMYQAPGSSGAFDELKFTSLDPRAHPDGEEYLYTNLPYLLGDRGKMSKPVFSFLCRRQNWNAECCLMQATRGSADYVLMAFGGGDLIPMRLDAGINPPNGLPDHRQPAHMVQFSQTVADKQYQQCRTFSSGNEPYFIGQTAIGNQVQYTGFSIATTPGTAGTSVGPTTALQFPPNIYVAGQASTTFTTVANIAVNGPNTTDTGAFVELDENGNALIQQFQVVPYNNLVYLVRAVSNVPALAQVGVSNSVSGLLIDTYVPTPSGTLALAQGARYKQSGLQYFGSTYTPTTMVDTLDQLDFTGITGATFYAPTIFIPIPELDGSSGLIVNLSDFLGQQIWTIIYPEIVAQPGATVNGVSYPKGLNMDSDGKPVLSLQKLHFVYDPLAVLFTPNDLSHKYPLQPKQQILALTNGQVREGLCWRSANLQPDRLPPSNVCAQQILAQGIGMDRTNIIYSSQNRAVQTPLSDDYMGMSVNSFVSVSGTVYNIEESAMQSDQTGTGFISQVSSTSNMLIGVLFDYDNNDLGTLSPYDQSASSKGVVFLNGYLSASGYSFSSPDHFDVNDVLPSQVPMLDEIADILGYDVAFYNIDASLPRQFWSLAYDAFTAAGLPNYIANVPPAPADPAFSNRTRSLILNLENALRPTELGLIDTFSSVVSANLHLENGITGSVFLSKKADRDIASIGTNPAPLPGSTGVLYGLPTKYDFFIFSRDHYATLQGCYFELIDAGYAMCLVDDGTGTGTKISQYYIDSDGNYYELYNYVLYSPSLGVLESSSFNLKVTLGSPANLFASPVVPETPNSINPQDLVAQINKGSNLIYAAFGPSSPGQPAAYLPIQAVGGQVQAEPIVGAPGFNGYSLNVASASRQPVQISQIYSGSQSYSIAGSTTIVPVNAKSGKAVPFYGSLSHGLDKQLPVSMLQSADLSSSIPAVTVPAGPSQGIFGGNGMGALIGTPFSRAFQGSGAIPAAIASNANPGTIIKGDAAVFYTFNGVNNAFMDSTGKSGSASGSQYFIDKTDPANPIYGVISLPKFTLNGSSYSININTALADGVTSCYTLTVGGKSYPFSSANQVTVDRTIFTFNPLSAGTYAVTYASVDAPAQAQAPTPVTLTPFSMTAGGATAVVDVFNNAAGLNGMVLGPAGRVYHYDLVHAQVTITQGVTNTLVSVETGLAFVSASFYGYVIGFDQSAGTNGGLTVNGQLMYSYAASTTGAPSSFPIMTSPQLFTLDGNFYTFDKDANGNYVTVTGNGQAIPVNPYQFSLNGAVYIINTNVQPYTVIGGGNSYTMTAGNTQFVINGVQYTIVLKSGSLNGATISGQFDITQANVVVVENYVYELDLPNGQIVGNGIAYPLTNAGFTYSIISANQSFTVTTEANASTVTIGDIVYQINNTTVVGDGVVYPILPFRTFSDGPATYQIGDDGTANLPKPFVLTSGAASTFTDGSTYTVNAFAAFDGANYFLQTGNPTAFTAGGVSWQLRTDGVAISAGSVKTYIATTGPLQPNQFSFGAGTIFFGRPSDIAAFDGANYYAIKANSFTDSGTGATYTLSGNTAVNQGNSYEIYSNLGQGAYFEVPGGKTYFVNIQVADLGTSSGTIFQVFPISGSTFTMPLEYTIAVSGATVTINSSTFTGGPVAVNTLTAAGGNLTGGFFVDPVTGITYTCVVDGAVITFVDSNNAIYSFPSISGGNKLVALIVISTGFTLAVDSASAATVFPVINGQFIAAAGANTITYTVNVPVAFINAAGPYWPMVNGRFVVPQALPISNTAYTVRGNNVIKGYVISNDDEFSTDGNIVYTVNAVNVVRSSNQAVLNGSQLVDSAATYTLNTHAGFASIQPAGLQYNTGTSGFAVSYNGLSVTYKLTGSSVTDNRHPLNTFAATLAGSQVTFTDTVIGVTFTFDNSGANPVTVEFTYTNNFFADSMAGVTYYIDTVNGKVEAISYLSETTQYAFTAANGVTYLIHYNAVDVVFPVVSGANVNAGVASVGSDIFSIKIDQVNPTISGTAIPINQNSFEINGNLYTISGTPAGNDYSACSIVGDAIPTKQFASANTFILSDPAVTFTLHLDSNDLPERITASFPVKPSRDLVSVNDDIYLITYNTVSAGSLLGQGQPSIPIGGSGFKLSNPNDSTTAKFVFDDQDIYDAGSVVGQFSVYLLPTFFIGNGTYSLNTSSMIVTDNSKRPYPLIPNPAMFSINGFNYVIDTNRVPHAIIGNNNISPLSTDVTVQNGLPVPNSTFTLNGQIYAYVEDIQHNLLAITGTKLYMIAQPSLTFKLDSSLLFSINLQPPAAGNFAGTVTPIGTVTSGPATVLNLYAGTNESGGADYFIYKNVFYTLIKSGAVYTTVQKTYTVYNSAPVATQQQLAVFDLGGTTYLVTDGTTSGAATPGGINPATMWAQTAITAVETQFGVVYGLAAAPVTVTQSALNNDYQFIITNASGTLTLYNILYNKGSNSNMVQVNVPNLLPSFTQVGAFDFYVGDPLTFETGGYNAFTAAIGPTASPVESFAGAFKTPIIATDASLDNLIGLQGDFTVEFWHSIPLTPVAGYHPFTYTASTNSPLVYFIDVDFDTPSTMYIRINNTLLQALTAPPVFTSRWQHFALTYAQPYTMICQGAGYEVKKADNFDVNNDFSIAMTFAASDIFTRQGLVYKGTGSDNTAPGLQMSYRVCLFEGQVTLMLTDGNGAICQTEFKGPQLAENIFYQVIVVKHTNTAATGTDSSSTDPYDPPFNPGDMTSAASAGGSGQITPPSSGSGSASISGIQQNPSSPATQLDSLLKNINAGPTTQSFNVVISVRSVGDDGIFGDWAQTTGTYAPGDASGLNVWPTGAAHLLIGAAFDDTGAALPFGGTNSTGNIRDLYLFNSAIDPLGIRSEGNHVDLADATSDQLNKAGLLGYWPVKYDANGVVNDPLDPTAVATSTNASKAYLAPLTGHELEGVSLFIDGYLLPLDPVFDGSAVTAMPPYTAGNSLLAFNAGAYRLEEMSIWNMVRAQYEIENDLFGRLVPSNEPFLSVYLSGEFSLPDSSAPALPMNKFLDGIVLTNPASFDLTFSPASLDLIGSPCVARCGPLITPNLYTPPGVGLTVCDSVPWLTSYSVTLNTTTGTLAGEINEVYVYLKDQAIVLFAGKKVGDLVLTWVSQEQGDLQIIGYIEGAPPAPMANLTNKASYTGATSVTLSVPTSVTLKYQSSHDKTTDNKLTFGDNFGLDFGVGLAVSPWGFGVTMKDKIWELSLVAGDKLSYDWTDDGSHQKTATAKLDESNKYTVKMQGTLAPYTGDQFMAGLNTVTTASTTPGTPGSKAAILPNPNLGGFTASNPPAALPKTAVTEEKFGQRMFVPTPYGQAFVTSQTLDVYQQTLIQSNTVYGFVAVPNQQIPRDLNIVSFRLNSQYIRPGCLDGMIGYAYNPTKLANGEESYGTSTGQMEPVYDGNFSNHLVGHDASYMQVVHAYQIKKQIDQQAYNGLALYNTAYKNTKDPDASLTPVLDFYDEYVWSSRGAMQEVKHTYTTTYEEVLLTGNSHTIANSLTFNLKLVAYYMTALDAAFAWDHSQKDVFKYTGTNTASASFDIAASFDGIDTDTQMRYSANNDAHFVMNLNSQFNPNNQSGIELVIGSDGLVYQIVPSVKSGAGLPLSNNLDDSQTYMQPQPSYTSGNADGLTGNLEPYDRPGKTKLFRTYAFFLQPDKENANDFWSTVIDPVWLANSPDPDAAALRSAQGNGSVPWRLLYRVTYSERFLPPISAGSVAVPQIMPIMAAPVLNPASDFLFLPMTSLAARPAHNPANDIEANIVLAQPTQTGLSAGAIQTSGPRTGLPVEPNNVIPFDLIKTPGTPVNWGDSNNAKLLTQVITSALGTNVVPMSPSTLPGSILVAQVADPVNGGTLYTIYTDPNGLTVNVPTNFGVVVYQDVNGNPVQFFDGKTYYSLQSDYVASPDGTVMYYVQPPSNYDQSKFSLYGDYDLYNSPGDEWRYYLVSGMSSNMTSEVSFANQGPFLLSTGESGFTGFSLARSQHGAGSLNQVQGYVLVQGVLQYPNLNSNAEVFSDVLVYKAMALLDTFPIGDPEILIKFLETQYPNAPFVANNAVTPALPGNNEISLVFARNIISYFHTLQQALTPQ